jgi:YidC/Oxa1 family membrane protein insertase
MDNRRLILLLSSLFRWSCSGMPGRSTTSRRQRFNRQPSATARRPTPQPSGKPAYAASGAPGDDVRRRTRCEGPKRQGQDRSLCRRDFEARAVTSSASSSTTTRTATDKDKDFALFEAKHQYVAQSGLIGEGLPNHKTVFCCGARAGNSAATQEPSNFAWKRPCQRRQGGQDLYLHAWQLSDQRRLRDRQRQREGIAAHAYYQLQRDTEAPDWREFDGQHLHRPGGLYRSGEVPEDRLQADIEKGKAKFATKADNGWMAMVQHYFVSAWIPQPGSCRASSTCARSKEAPVRRSPPGSSFRSPLLRPGSKASNVFRSLYAGPQIQTTLEQLAKPSRQKAESARRACRWWSTMAG